MEKANLTETIIKKIKHKQKQFKLSDGDGLYLLVHPNGSKYWRFDFRFEGKQKSSSLGVWPEISIAHARTIRNSAKNKIRDGINPIEEKRRKKTSQIMNFHKQENFEELNNQKTFEDSDESETNNLFLFSRGKNIQVECNEIFQILFPNFGKKDFSKITKEDLIQILKNISQNRKKLFSIFLKVYPAYPLLQLSIVYILLFLSTDLFSAFFITIFLFFSTVSLSVLYDYLKNK